MKIKAVKGIIIKNNKYLLQLRDNKKNISYPNHWGLFGGRINRNEKLVDAVKREIKEEINLEIKIISKVFSIDFTIYGLRKKRHLTYFDCKILDKKKLTLLEGKSYKFISFSKLKNIKIVPLDYVAIKNHYLKNKSFINKYR